MPKKRPIYRAERDHASFLRRIKEFNISADDFLRKLETVCSESFDVVTCTSSETIAEAELCLKAAAISGSAQWTYRTNYEIPS